MPLSSERINISKVKKIIIKKLSFLPYVEYVPDVIPKEPGLMLLDELQNYENIVDPLTNTKVNVKSNRGKQLLQIYSKLL